MNGTGLAALALAVAAGLPAAAQAQTLTPAGPATLTNGAGPNAGCPAWSGGPAVIVAWEVVVGAGGSAGTVRPRFGDVLGDAVQLPAEPGRYRFPAPHLPRDMNTCGETPGLVQTGGGHAVFTPAAGSFTHTRVQREGEPEARVDGVELTTDMIVERDYDRDLLGDETEDRTDLRITTRTVREADHRARVDVTITNAGPLAADRPSLEVEGPAGGRWVDGACTAAFSYPRCLMPPLAAGASRTIQLRGDFPQALAGEIRVRSEGPDLQDADNRAPLTLEAAPPLTLETARSHRLGRGIKVALGGVHAGRVRVTATLRRGGKRVKLAKQVEVTAYGARTLTLRATGAKLRSLRRMLAGGAVEGRVTLRPAGGGAAVTAEVKLRR